MGSLDIEMTRSWALLVVIAVVAVLTCAVCEASAIPFNAPKSVVPPRLRSDRRALTSLQARWAGSSRKPGAADAPVNKPCCIPAFRSFDVRSSASGVLGSVRAPVARGGPDQNHVKVAASGPSSAAHGRC